MEEQNKVNGVLKLNPELDPELEEIKATNTRFANVIIAVTTIAVMLFVAYLFNNVIFSSDQRESSSMQSIEDNAQQENQSTPDDDQADTPDISSDDKPESTQGIINLSETIGGRTYNFSIGQEYQRSVNIVDINGFKVDQVTYEIFGENSQYAAITFFDFTNVNPDQPWDTAGSIKASSENIANQLKQQYTPIIQDVVSTTDNFNITGDNPAQPHFVHEINYVDENSLSVDVLTVQKDKIGFSIAVVSQDSTVYNSFAESLSVGEPDAQISLVF